MLRYSICLKAIRPPAAWLAALWSVAGATTMCLEFTLIHLIISLFRFFDTTFTRISKHSSQQKVAWMQRAMRIGRKFLVETINGLNTVTTCIRITHYLRMSTSTYLVLYYVTHHLFH